MEKTFGTPYEIGYPAAGELVPNLDYQGKKILVVHQQVMAEAIRQEILKRENSAEVQTATWFMRKKELACPQDVSLREEDDYIDLVEKMVDLISFSQMHVWKKWFRIFRESS